ncbi:MAG TPA: 3'-5' exonuclease [Kiritimatiellia bacterium]|nr:3'-5' exonuclease [Kiritimatiellia bacterium]MBP9571819.1 3'-5' exonuclease [Kiritimatiellia bacterium]HQF20203.1 3'-5' exonuclease [Kiritimatiellia bacterium]
MKVRDAILTVLDFESTGAVSGHADEPWQVGMVEMQGGRVTGRHYESFLRVAASRPFNPYAPGRHAVLRPVLAAAPTPGELWPRWQPWLVGRPLAAHNVGTEKKFVQRAAPLHEFGPWLDTLQLARRVRPDLAGHALGEVCHALGLVARLQQVCPGRDWHDALYDAFASALILEYCLALPGWEAVSIAALAAGPDAKSSC